MCLRANTACTGVPRGTPKICTARYICQQKCYSQQRRTVSWKLSQSHWCQVWPTFWPKKPTTEITALGNWVGSLQKCWGCSDKHKIFSDCEKNHLLNTTRATLMAARATRTGQTWPYWAPQGWWPRHRAVQVCPANEQQSHKYDLGSRLMCLVVAPGYFFDWESPGVFFQNCICPLRKNYKKPSERQQAQPFCGLTRTGFFLPRLRNVQMRLLLRQLVTPFCLALADNVWKLPDNRAIDWCCFALQSSLLPQTFGSALCWGLSHSSAVQVSLLQEGRDIN